MADAVVEMFDGGTFQSICTTNEREATSAEKQKLSKRLGIDGQAFSAVSITSVEVDTRSSKL